MPDLVCVKCKAVPRPVGPLKERYSCSREAHSFCANCRKSSCRVCGGKVMKIPNRVLTLLLEDMPYACQYFKDGCREIHDLETLHEHEYDCNYRIVYRPNIFMEWMRASLRKTKSSS